MNIRTTKTLFNCNQGHRKQYKNSAFHDKFWIYDDFGGGLRKIHARYKWWREAPVVRTRKSKYMLTFPRTKPCQYKISSPLEGHRDHRPTSSTANTPSTRYRVPGITHDVRRAIAHGDTPSRADEWDRVMWNSWGVTTR